MSRIVGGLALIIALAGGAPALAADMPMDAAVAAECGPPRVEVARYQEQVCHRGVAGYAECRWIDREHEVVVTAHCEPRFTVETARPARRGAFPPFPYVAPRG